MKNSEAKYTPVLGLHNCPTILTFKSEGKFSGKQSGQFQTKCVVSNKHTLNIQETRQFRIGFERIPTFQNDDFWNLPDKYVEVIYPSEKKEIAVTGEYYKYSDGEMLVADLTKYRSHPDKPLLMHTCGVVKDVKQRTTFKIAEIAAIFHDVGKLNPNFQRKLDMQKTDGYSNHAYLSAFSFLCYCAANQEAILKIFNNEKEWLGSILAIIAHHHGDLPDFPIILTENEYSRLLSFLNENPELPVSELVEGFISHNRFSVLNHQLKDHFQNSIQIQIARQISKPLDFFLETQFAFASLIAADKSDASQYQSNNSIQDFCSQYHDRLDIYLKGFSDDSELNKIRSRMRKEANQQIRNELSKGARMFSLTAPTGSGKTMMLLSLAGDILKHQNNLRIIYALPYLSITEQVERGLPRCL